MKKFNQYAGKIGAGILLLALPRVADAEMKNHPSGSGSFNAPSSFHSLQILPPQKDSVLHISADTLPAFRGMALEEKILSSLCNFDFAGGREKYHSLFGAALNRYVQIRESKGLPKWRDNFGNVRDALRFFLSFLNKSNIPPTTAVSPLLSQIMSMKIRDCDASTFMGAEFLIALGVPRQKLGIFTSEINYGSNAAMHTVLRYDGEFFNMNSKTLDIAHADAYRKLFPKAMEYPFSEPGSAWFVAPLEAISKECESRIIGKNPPDTAFFRHGLSTRQLLDAAISASEGAFSLRPNDWIAAHYAVMFNLLNLKNSLSENDLKGANLHIKAAYSAVNRWFSLDPGSAPAHLMRGEIYRLSGNNESALSDFKKAIELSKGRNDIKAAAEKKIKLLSK